jgi:Transposase IS116/IS110/IS902 family
MTGPRRYPPAIHRSHSVFLEKIEECGEGFAEWALKKMVEIAVEIVIELLL